eukprot:jgi/Mesen1/3279/ME000019S02691
MSLHTLLPLCQGQGAFGMSFYLSSTSSNAAQLFSSGIRLPVNFKDSNTRSALFSAKRSFVDARCIRLSNLRGSPRRTSVNIRTQPCRAISRGDSVESSINSDKLETSPPALPSFQALAQALVLVHTISVTRQFHELIIAKRRSILTVKGGRGSSNIRQEKRASNLPLTRVAGVGLAVALGFFATFSPRTFLQQPLHAPPPALAATTKMVLKGRPKKIEAKKATWQDKAVYALDYFFSVEPWSKSAILLMVCLAMVVVGGYIYHPLSTEDSDKGDIRESFWHAWACVSDPGTHVDEDSFPKRAIALPLSVGGMLFFALLVGIITDSVSSKVDDLKKGSAMVIENNHTLIVGWTPKTVHLVKELNVANQERGSKRSIVVMGSEEKEAMDDALLDAVPLKDRRGSKVITRKGSPGATEDLRKCSASSAGTVVVAQTCMVLANIAELNADIVAEFAAYGNVRLLEDMHSTLMARNGRAPTTWTRAGAPPALPAPTPASADSGEAMQKWVSLSPFGLSLRANKLVPVAAGDIVMRLMVERVLQPSTAAVSQELLHFEGCEFHFKYWPELVGKTFGEVAFLFDKAVPCGILRQSQSGGVYTYISPPADTIIQEGEKVLVISEDADSYKMVAAAAAPATATFKKPALPAVPAAKRVLLCGWRSDVGEVMLSLLDSHVGPGSEVTILADEWPEDQLAAVSHCSKYSRNLKITTRSGSPVSKRVLEKLPLERFDCVMLLAAPPGEESSMGVSSPSASAMYIRHIQAARGRLDSTIIAELAAVPGDALESVQRDWLDDSILPDAMQALARVLRDQEVAIAHKCASAGGRWTLNPPNKGEKLRWSDKDEVIVLTKGQAR